MKQTLLLRVIDSFGIIHIRKKNKKKTYFVAANATVLFSVHNIVFMQIIMIIMKTLFQGVNTISTELISCVALTVNRLTVNISISLRLQC